MTRNKKSSENTDFEKAQNNQSVRKISTATKSKYSISGDSPLRLLLILIGGIVLSNIIVEMLFWVLPPMSVVAEPFLNTAVILIFIIPLLYFFFSRPMTISITRRKEAEATEKESESKYRLLFENMEEGFSLQEIITDVSDHPIDFRFLDINAAYERHTGLKPSDCIGRTIREIMPQADDVQIENYGKVALTGEPMVFEYTSKTFNRHLRVRAFCPQPGQFATIFEDITERKQAENALAESEARFKGIFENNSVAIAIIEPDSTISMTNDAFCRFAGRTKQEITGSSWTLYVAPEDLERLKEFNRQRMVDPGNAPKNYEFSFCRKDGELRVGMMWVALIPSIKKIIISVSDITERKQAEDKAESLSRRYQTLLQNASDGIHILDVNGNVIEANAAFADMLGYTPKEVLQLNVADWEAYFAGKELFEKVNELFEVPAMFETRHRRKDGTIVDVEINASSIILDGHKYQYASARDISERKRTEKEIELKNEELQFLNAEKDKFFSIIAHDLRSPFNVFLNLTRMLEKDLPTMTREQIQKFVQMMGISATNLFRLLENLLEWSRLQRGLITANPELFPLMPNVKSSMDSVKDAATKKGIEISTDMPADLVVFADERMLDGILRNLSTNAVKFTLKGGKIIIAANPIPDGDIEISVTDTGIGMTKEMAENIFRLDVNTSRKGTDGEPSTGLGLIICKEFVEKQGGKLWVESEVGKGSTFYFTLPGSNDYNSWHEL